MRVENYQTDLWPLIYDQYNQGPRHQQELAFYAAELAGCRGPVLEAACGTGMILLELLERGIDAYGFDLSAQMLAALYAKAEQRHIEDIHRRVSRQDMAAFRYEMRFEAAIIPNRSFLHLAEQEAQIACLRSVHAHLKEGGRLLLNFFTPSLQALLDHADPPQGFRALDTLARSDTGEPVRVSFAQQNDLAAQVQHLTWRFESGGTCQESAMDVRWIYAQEFPLLLRLAGFRTWAVYSGFDRRPYDGTGEMVWIAQK